MQWSRDLTVESHLTAHNIGWTFRERVPFDSIHVDRGPGNNARLSADIDGEKLDEYAQAMKQGATFPAVVLYPNCTGLDISGGNHRLRALKKAGLHNSCPPAAYVLDGDDPLKVEVVTRTLNFLNGKGIPQEEKIAMAVEYLQKNPDMNQGDVAREFILKPETFSRALRAFSVREELILQGVAGASRLLDATLVPLYKLRNEIPVQIAVAQVAISEEYNADTVKMLIETISDARSENNKLEAIAQFVEAARSTHRPVTTKGKSRPATTLQGIFTRLDTLLTKHPSWEALHITSKSEQNEFRRLRDGLVAKLARVVH